MSWCPKCKMEYREGVEVCADCGVSLVNSLNEDIELEPFIETTKEDAEKFVKFLEYSSLTADFVEKESLEDEDIDENTYTVRIQQEDILEVKKLYAAYLTAEKENNSDENQKASKSDEAKKSTNLKESNTYVRKADQYEDLKSSASTFLIFGVLGLIFATLNVADIIPFIDNIVGQVVMFVLFILFIFIGITTRRKAKQVKNDISAEDEMTNTLNEWLEANLTSEFIESLKDNSLSDEINFINLMEKVKLMIQDEFGEINESYVDQIAEEFYNKNF